MLDSSSQKESVFLKVFPETLGLVILLVIAILGARFAFHVADAVNEMKVDFVEAVDPMVAHNPNN
jgi:hypothetical protein